MADVGTAGGGGNAAANNQNPSQRNNRRGGGRNGGEAGGDSANAGRDSGRGGRGRGRGRGGGGRGGNRGGDSQPASGEGSSNNNSSNNNRRRGGGGRGRGGHQGGAEGEASAEPRISQKDPILRSTQQSDAVAGAEDGDEEDDAEVCFICANPVIHHAIAPCNHLTCHICALRMRALYRTKDCPHCRTPAPYVIFTDDPSKRFEDYSAADITSTDDNIGIKYTNEDIVGDTVLLLRYNCPDDSCDYAGLGWPDLHRHVRSEHHKKMCDLCTRNKKVFTHEHDLFSDKGLETHMRNGNDKPGAKDQSGFRGHPLCGFCGERFYDDDKLYEHCRNKHERCFICDRQDSRKPHYFRNYNELEKHFSNDHYLCLDRECMEKKFVVFGSEMDLKAHQLTEHGNTLSKDVRRDVQVVSMADFNYRPSQSGRNGGGGGGGGGRQSRGRDPNADAPAPVATSQNMRRDEIAYQRQLNIHSAQNVTNRTFGSHLSTPAPTPAEAGPSRQNNRSQNNQRNSTNSNKNNTSSNSNNNNNVSTATPSSLINPMETLSVQDMSQMTPQDRARAVRHGAVIERASNMLGSNPTKIAKFRAHISSFRQGSWTAAQLVDAFSSLFADTSDTALGSLVREVADLFEDPVQADALRRALSDRRAVNDRNGGVTEDYPSLPTLGGMHGATTSTSGWAAAASSSEAQLPNAQSAQRNSSTRVLRLKHSTRLGGPSTTTASLASAPRSNVGPAGRAVPGATWTAPPSSRPGVLSSASMSSASSASFPALPSTGKKSASAGSSWTSTGGGPASSLAARVGGASANIVRPSTYSSPAPSSASSARRPAGGEDNFPALPAAAKPPPPSVFSYGRRTVRRDLGGNQDTGFSWTAGGSAADAAENEVPEEEPTGKGKKKGKKVLVQWG
ncbi:zinc finger protein [Ophiostoma piceae UAMH 11346]|uniref:RING-type E3 ubiquitin transferase n=1 Tax=Ophiostoma piceae (strain UAMH 11346) TaxID=1262450 RepID=S3C024_OPHP1|nr:zinc finger protein [Ophiostoma piceae UAMH 11346]